MNGPAINPEEILDQVLETLADRLAARLLPEFKAASGVRQRLFSVEDGAAYLGRSVHSVRHLIASGKLPVVKMDQRLFLDLQDLDRIIAESKASRG